MRYSKSIIFIIGILISTCMNSSKVFSETSDFSITPMLPDNQNVEVQNYFDLKVKPNQKQTLELVVSNTSNELQEYKIAVNTANTNNNGIVDYSMSNFKKDKSMKISLKDCFKLEKEIIEIPPNKEKIISMEMTIPPADFDGILLGGVVVEPLIKTSDAGITNHFTRTIAIKLSENEKEIETKLSIGDSVISQENLRNVLKMKFGNIESKLLSIITADITISKKNDSKFLLKDQKQQLSFAPNSNFYLTTNWTEMFSPGEYAYKVIFKDDAGHQWVLSKEFHIKKNSAKKLNQTSIDKKKFNLQDYLLNKWYLFFLFIMLYLFCYYIYKKKVYRK